LPFHATQQIWRDPKRNSDCARPSAEELVDMIVELLIGHVIKRVDPRSCGAHS
jgi:hypothetical protein